MKFSVPIRNLKSMGFEYVGGNYKSYQKSYGSITLQLIVCGREIWVTKWGRYTKDIIDFVRSNYDKWLKFELPGQLSNKDAYMPLMIDDTGHIILETPAVHITKLQNPIVYNTHRDLYINKNDFDLFFEDIKKLV